MVYKLDIGALLRLGVVGDLLVGCILSRSLKIVVFVLSVAGRMSHYF
jgi:hypothetical protein